MINEKINSGGLPDKIMCLMSNPSSENKLAFLSPYGAAFDGTNKARQIKIIPFWNGLIES